MTTNIDIFCACDGFMLWYVENNIRVCHCGHPDVEHIDGKGMCVGDSTVTRGANMTQSQRQALIRQITEAQRQLAQLEALPQEDSYSDGHILRIVVMPTYGDQEPLTYAFVKVNAPTVPTRVTTGEPRWYFTGELFGYTRAGGPRWVRWSTIIEWLTSGAVELVLWDDMVPAEKE